MEEERKKAADDFRSRLSAPVIPHTPRVSELRHAQGASTGDVCEIRLPCHRRARCLMQTADTATAMSVPDTRAARK